MTAGPWEQYSGGQTTEAAGPWTKFGGGQASKAQVPESDETFLGLSKGGLKASGEALGKIGLSTANELAVFGDMFINSVNSLVPMAAAGATQYIKGLFTGADASKTSKLARQAVTMAAEQYSPDVLKKLVGAISEYVPQEVRPGASQQESFIQKAMDLTDIDAKNLELATNGVVKKEDVQNIRDILLTTLGAKGGVEGAKRLTEAKPPEPGKPAAAEAPKGGAEEDVLSKWKAKATEAEAERKAAEPPPKYTEPPAPGPKGAFDAMKSMMAEGVDQYGKPLKGSEAGRATVDQISTVLGLSAAGAAGLYAYQNSESGNLQNAILAGSAVLAARGLPRYFRYVREDWRGALKTTAAAGIAAATVGGIQKDPVAAALAGLAVGGFKMLPRHVPLEVKPGLTMDQLVNLRADGLATREREYLTMKAAIKTAVPDPARREAITRAIDSGDLRGLSARERDVAAAWKGFSDAIGKEALDEGLMKDFVQNYVTHVVERKGLPKSMVQEAMDTIFATRSQGAGLPMTSKFMRSRRFETIADLEKALEKTNLQLRTLDLAEIAEIYGRSMGRAIENKRFVDVLKEAREGGQLGKGSPFILGEEKAPASYVRVNVPALRGNLVHPDIAGPLKFVMEARTENELINGALALSMAQKRLAVGGSFFHAMNLGLAHLGAHGLRGAADLGREVLGGAGFPVDRPIRAAIENYRRGGAGDTIDELLRAGLQTKPLADVNVNALSQLGGLADQISAKLLGDRVKPFTKAADVLETVQKRYFDHFTWDYMHSGLKLLTATREFEKALRENPGMPREEVARRVASYTNDTYGGLDWQRVAQEATSGLGRRMANIALSPNGRILTQIALFAPDWSLSTFRAMFRALPGAESSLKSRWAGIPMTLQQRYALRTGLFYLTLVDGINYQTSGHHLWENKDPLRIEFRDGTAMQAFKHAAEFGEWLQDPIKVARNKLGAIPKELVSQVDSVQFPGSKTPLTGAGPRLAHAAEEFLPFGLKPIADPSLTPGEAAVRGALGTVGVQFYGRTAEQKQRLKDDPGKQEAREKKKLARILEPKL